MIKVLQKYKMYVLVVAGVLIMISFLMADVIRQLTQYSIENERVYNVDGSKVTRSDVNQAAIHLEGLKRALGNEMPKATFGLDDDATQWQLAAAAAEKAGVVGGPADGRAVARLVTIQKIARQAQQAGAADWRAYMKSMGNLTDEQVEQRIDQITEATLIEAGRTGNAAAEGANAFAEFRGLLRLRQSYADVPQTSENRLAAEARRLLDVAVLRYVYVPLTESRIAAAPAPTQEEMQAQFDKYKDTPIGGGTPGGTGVGYRQGDRITYTWFAVDKSAISKAVKVDPIEVSKRALSRSPDGKVDAAVRTQIEDEIRGELTQRAVDDFTSTLRAEFQRANTRLPDKDGYKVLPADWKKPDLAAIVSAAVQRLATEKKITIPVPEVHTVATPQDARAFMMEKGIGMAMLPRTGQQPVFLGEVLFGAKELGKPVGKVAAQVGVPIPVAFTGGNSNLHFVMLDSALPAASPKTLDEVRPLVEKDLRKVKALAQLKADIEAHIAPIVQLGMTAAPDQLLALGYPGLTVQNAETRRGGWRQEQFGQRYTYLVEASPKIPAAREVQDESFVEAAVSRAEKLDPGMHVAPDSAAERTFVHPLTAGDGVVLAQVTGLKPVTQEMFRDLASDPSFRALVESKEMGGMGELAPFKTDALIKRLNVTGLDRSKKNDE